jgi:hypothetical protein
MNSHQSRRLSPLLPSVLAVVLLAIATAAAATPHEKVLYNFQGGKDGAFPSSDLIADADGNLFGTTVYGGTGLCTDSDGFVIGCGTVFKLIKPAVAGGKWMETVLYSFQGLLIGNSNIADSGYPRAALTFDADGNLYGTTSGGTVTERLIPDNGAVFELKRPAAKGAAWSETILHAFKGGYDGDQPQTRLVFDKEGRIYGTTSDGSPLTGGTVFRLTPPAQVGGAWTETPLYAFSGGTDGQTPVGIVFDSKGNIFGTTSAGGGFSLSCGGEDCDSWVGGGTFFKITPNAQQSKPWSESLPFIFPPCVFYSLGDGESCGDDSLPESGLIADATGKFYGTSKLGGAGCLGRDDYELGCGAVFQFVPPAVAGGAWTQNILFTFGNPATGTTTDGAYPIGTLAFDSAGNLYGAEMGSDCTSQFCFGGFGTIFELTPPSSPGGTWTETTLYQFQGGNDGATPAAGMLVKGSALYSTTQSGGTGNCLHTVNQPAGCGTVYEISH